jgi:hypothetical protein
MTDTQPQVEPSAATPTPEAHDSGIRALAAVARHHQLDWSLQRLTHMYAKGRASPPPRASRPACRK